MRWRRAVAFFLGIAALIALTAYAGAGAVARAFLSLKLGGLAIICLVHLPVVALLGAAWWLVGSDTPQETVRRFAWARLVRDAAAEVLPFSQLGGFVLGVRALQLAGVSVLRAALSMSVDLIMELWAKLPYFVAGALIAAIIAPRSALSGALPAAIGLTTVAVGLPFLLRHRLRRALESSAMALAKRWPALGTGADAPAYFDHIFARWLRLIASFCVHLTCWALGAAETWIIFALMGFRLSAAEAFAIDSLFSGLRTFGFLVPGAAGVQEASYVLVCALFGFSPATAIAVSLARRARDIALGLPTLAVWQYLESQAASATSDR